MVGAALAMNALTALLCAAAATAAAVGGPSSSVAKLVVTGRAEIVWNQTRDACPGKNRYGHPGEQPDSMPIAWHNPKLNRSYLIGSVNWGTYPTVGPSLSQLQEHDCSDEVFKSVNDSTPMTYLNHQWLQSTRIFPDGTGFALVHNEFHGEQIGEPWCTYDHKTPTSQCILWSSDLGRTVDGGEHWEVVHAPLITLPRRYIKDAPRAGYGALGTVIQSREDGFYYGHVYRSYNNGTGAGPAGTSASGICAWRASDPHNASTYRGWNGTHWSTVWVDPYTTQTPPDELWMRTCADVDVGGYNSSHVALKRFAGSWRPQGWPEHVLVGWPDGNTNEVAYSFPRSPSSFTSWEAAGYVDLNGWMSPHVLRPLSPYMYPSMLDHDSPFSLSGPSFTADGLSYALVGNSSLHIYAVMRRELIVRWPVAWLTPDQPTPPAPFPPVPPVPLSCNSLLVAGAGLGPANGVYRKQAAEGGAGSPPSFVKDDSHAIYCFADSPKHPCRWTMAHRATQPVYYEANEDTDGSASVPGEWWIPVGAPSPSPTITCAD